MHWSALIPVASALAGIYVGSQLNQRNEHRRWIREQRFKAYQTLMQTVSGLVGTSPSEEDPYDKRLKRLSGAVSDAMFVSNSALSYEVEMIFTGSMLADLPKGERIHDRESIDRFNDFAKRTRKAQTLFQQELGFVGSTRYPLRYRIWGKLTGTYKAHMP